MNKENMENEGERKKKAETEKRKTDRSDKNSARKRKKDRESNFRLRTLALPELEKC